MADERGAGGQLMGESERKGEVGVEVDRPPRLVRQPAAGAPVGRDARRGKQDECDARGQEPRQRRQQRPALGQDPRPCPLGIPQHGGQAVRGDQHQRSGSETARPGDESILAERALDHREASRKQNRDEQRVGADQAGHAPGERPRAAGGGQGARRLDRQAERDRHSERQTQQDSQSVHRPRARGRGTAPGQPGNGDRRVVGHVRNGAERA
jgi:hypothetical protein